MFLLDTNVVLELRRPARANLCLVAWSEARRSSELYLSAISILELEIGALRIGRRDKPQAETLFRWIEQTIDAFGERVLPIDLDVARRCAPLHVPDPRPDRDAYIAATALVHNLTIVTRNVRDFEGTGVKLLNPWDA